MGGIKNYNFIEFTVQNTIKMINAGKLAKFNISAYVSREDDDLSRIYEIRPPKQIHFNTFGIQKYLGTRLPRYFDNKYQKMKSDVVILILSSIVYEYIGNMDEEESELFALKWLVNHNKLAKKMLGRIDITEYATRILSPCKAYEEYLGQ